MGSPNARQFVVAQPAARRNSSLAEVERFVLNFKELSRERP
jgi:hypothetical protein